MHSKSNNNKSKNFIQGLRPLSISIPRGLKTIIKKRGYNFNNIIDNWTKMVGKDISNACYPTTIKVGKDMNNGTLTLNVLHGREIDVEYSKKIIIDKINGFFGYNYINQVKLKIISEKIPKEKTSKKNNLMNKRFEKKLTNLQDPKLKNNLHKLIEAYNEKNN
jgi:hypothetical protein|tara:strand:+ start:271 stop:759 length:489 start_codon:yes stop_codon:yes gene_type:complete